MPANTSPIFALTPRAVTATIAIAVTNRDGTGSITDVLTAGSNGTRIDFVTFTSAQATPAASAARVQRVYITDTSGANSRLISEIVLPAVTASATAIGATATITYTNGLILASGQKLQVSQSIYGSANDTTQVLVRGGDY
jgi:hypothetical protein